MVLGSVCLETLTALEELPGGSAAWVSGSSSPVASNVADGEAR